MFLIILSLLVFCFIISRTKRTLLFTDWPVVGMLPGIIPNIHQIHDYISKNSKVCKTFEFEGGWFSSLNMLVTCDPVNIDYIFRKNFTNYPKGPDFKKVFEMFRDAIINSDFELWKFHKKTLVSYMSGAKFYSMLHGAVCDKVQTGLLPVLEHFSENGMDIDLQEILQRFTFDNICKIVLDHDPKSLSVDMPYIACEKAFNDLMEPLLLRHIVPESIWKLQKWLNIGSERKLLRASNAFDEFLYPIVEKQLEVGGSTFLSALKNAYVDMNSGSLKGLTKSLRDTSLNLMVAGRDTTSACLTWLFWLLATNPLVEMKIFEEIQSKMDKMNPRLFDVQETHKLVYLHGALCESLRLFPPIAIEHKTPIQSDTLPSGHSLEKNKKAIISFYAVGRMEEVWGNDCLEFKPERWINDRGGVKHEQACNFPAFSVGPRNCIGTEMAFIQMKIVASAIIHDFKIQLVEGHPVSPSSAVIIQAKHGLRVRLSKRYV